MDIYQEIGHTALWVGPGSGVAHWGPSNMAQAARAARGMGIDTISPKRAEGTVKWYNSVAQLRAERAAALDQGAGFVAHFYSDGPRFGPGFVDKEAAVIEEMLDAAGFVCLDMEAEWDGQEAAAERLAHLLAGHHGTLLINPWANPEAHNWHALALHLNTIADGWIPQQYNDALAKADETVYHGPIMVGIDLTQEFGVNHQTNIAHAAMARGERSAFLWEYEAALKNPALVRQIVAVMEGHATASAPASGGAVVASSHQVIVMPGDTLSSIADRYDVKLADIEAWNEQTIRAACNEHQVAFSFDHIWPGMILKVG